MSADPEDSEDETNARNDEQESEEQESELEGESERNSEDNGNRTASPFGISFAIPDLRATLNAGNLFNIRNLINPEILRMLRDPIDPELRLTLTQPVIDPEVIRQIQQPVIDPEIIRQIQQPMINTDLLHSLRQPAIDPELIEVLQSLNNSTTIDLYRTAAALEQLEQEDVDEIEGTSKEELENELEEDLEPPRQGGLLSTFFNATAIILLNQPDDYSEESIDALQEVLQSETVQAKTDAFRNFVSSAGSAASQTIILATATAFHLSWGMHFADDLEDDGNDTDKYDDEGN